jgi:hypothetical protein
MLKSIEKHEHAEHIAHGEGGHADAEQVSHAGRIPALVVAVLAACLAVTEQGAKHAEIRVQESSIAAADAWAQYQAKSTRATIALDISRLISALDATTTGALAQRERVIKELGRDQERYEQDPQDGKQAISQRAHAFEIQRNRALEETHAYHNGAAAMELGIVLATVSAILSSRLLFRMSLVVGAIGVIFGALGYFAPEYGAL